MVLKEFNSILMAFLRGIATGHSSKSGAGGFFETVHEHRFMGIL